MSIVGSINERGYPIAVRPTWVVYACSVLEKSADDLEVTMVASFVKRYPPAEVPGINISSLGENSAWYLQITTYTTTNVKCTLHIIM